MTSRPRAYCLDLVRRLDHDGIYPYYFYKEDTLKYSYLALRAFQVEVVGASHGKKNPLAGKLRLKFWEDVVEGCYRRGGDTTSPTSPQQPVAIALKEAVSRHALSRTFLKRLVYARDHSDPPQTLSDLEARAEESHSSLLYLQLELLRKGGGGGGGKDPLSHTALHTLDHVASHLGKCLGIIAMLKAIPLEARDRRCFVPLQVSSQNGLSHEDLFRSGPQAKGLEDSVFQIATLANDHLLTSRQYLHEMDPGTRKRSIVPLLDGVLASRFLERLEKSNFAIFDPKCHLRDWKLPFSIYLANWRAKI